MQYNAAPNENKKPAPTKTPAESLESLLLLFPANELLAFYNDKSSQMLLLNAEDIERHQAVKELLQILTNYKQ